MATSELDIVKLKLESYKYGVSINKDKKWFIGTQYTFANSENFKNDFLRQENISYENANSVSSEVFYSDYNSITDYWKRIVYRLD